jgi:hypothetical protein
MQRLLLKRSLPESQTMREVHMARLRTRGKLKPPRYGQLAQFASSMNRTIGSTTASIFNLARYRNRSGGKS